MYGNRKVMSIARPIISYKVALLVVLIRQYIGQYAIRLTFMDLDYMDPFTSRFAEKEVLKALAFQLFLTFMYTPLLH